MNEDLESLHEIQQLKHAYFRLLDTKEFDELGELLTEDATSAYQSGELSHDGRAAIVAFLKKALGDPGAITMHTGHHPEITLDGDDSATGTWYLEDLVIVPTADLEIHGTAIYRDRYTRREGRWKISHTGYDRIFERHRKLSTGATTHIKSRFED
jgi:hypothetical protein